MSLVPGTKLGPFEIQSPLGSGGMGEVYRARDTRLNRAVAIKILPADIAQNQERKARFEREAKAISALQHPHICTLYDVGNQDGIDFLVMEYLEGQTLADRLRNGALPLDQVLRHGIEICEALETAHRNGVVHRDLKPGNIMLTKSGAKLLDFGLAKAITSAAVSAVSLTASVNTVNQPVTQRGTLVGTFQYMSPEQLEGKEADGRSDIFSLGAVLYEMSTGKKAFEGKTTASTIAAILATEPPPVSAVQPMTPPAFDQVVKACLAKDPDERVQSAHDLKLQLKWITEASSTGAPVRSVPARSRVLAWLPWGIAAVAFLCAMLLYITRWTPEQQRFRSMILPPEGGAFVFNGASGGAFLSPDGHSLAFIARVGKATQLWIRPLDSFTPHPVQGTDDVDAAFWSPDSRNLGFFAQGKLKRVAVAGGVPQTLCDVDSSRGGSWSQNDIIIFARVTGEILRIPAPGGSPQRVTTLDTKRHEQTHRWPYFLPDGNHFLFFAGSLGPASEDNVIYAGSLDGKPSRMLFGASSRIVYSKGHLLYLTGQTLMARPFDPVKLELKGEAFPIAEGVQFDPVFTNGIFSASENGLLVYQQGRMSSAYQLILYDRVGKEIRRLGEPAPYFSPRFSPDGRRLVFDLLLPYVGKVELWMLDLASGNRTRLASDGLSVVNHAAVWSPDGTHIAYSSTRTGTRAIYLRPVNEIAQEQERWEFKNEAGRSVDWTRDGKYLILNEVPFGTTFTHAGLLSAAGSTGPVSLIEVAGANADWAQVSPNNRWVAYRSDESGRNEIYVSRFPKPAGKLQISTAGGSTACWKNDGKELYYMAPDKMLMRVELKEVGNSLQVVAIRPLFQTKVTGNQYDADPNGSRFVVDSITADETSAPLNLVVNWARENR